MALITDGQINTLTDLQSYESSILETASKEAIDLNIKLTLAQRELEIEIGRWLARESYDGRIRLDNIVVTEALRRWHALQALCLAFRDAYHQQLNDRFMGKWSEYLRLASDASAALFESGVAVAWNPIRRADRPTLAALPGGLPAATYFVRVAWTNDNGAEGAPSESATIEAPEGSVIEVRAVNQPTGASAWNVYAGLSQEGATLQNTGPCPPGSPWSLPAAGLVSGRPAGQGQSPDSYLRAQHVLQRG